MVISEKYKNIKKILVIEDDLTMRKAIQLILRSGYDVFIKDNSRDVISLIKEVKPDLIITDLFLDNFNGLEIYEKFNENIPTLIMTGSAETSLAQKAKKIASGSFLEKSFLPEMLKVKIDVLLTKKKLNKEQS